MVPGAHDGPTNSDTYSDYYFVNYNPTDVRDFILVNRLRKSSRESLEPIDKATVLELFKKGKTNNGLEAKGIDAEAFEEAKKSARKLLGK